MASASSGIGVNTFTAASDPATMIRRNGGDTQTLILIAVAALAVLLFLRK